MTIRSKVKMVKEVQNSIDKKIEVYKDRIKNLEGKKDKYQKRFLNLQFECETINHVGNPCEVCGKSK